MTICIAALCAAGQQCIVAADREMTSPGLSLEFEHTEQKIDRVTDHCVVLSAGDALLSAEIVGRLALPSGTTAVRQVAERLRDTYQAVHLERVESVVLKPRGMSWQEYANRALQIPPQAYLNIDNMIFNFGIGVVDFLVAGVDTTGGHIFRVHYNGLAGGSWLEWVDKLGFRAIGSGQPHASTLLSLEGQHRGVSAADTLYNVYRAKRSAELAPGVGKATDMAVISSSGVEVVAETTLTELEEIRKSEARKSDQDAIRKIFDERPHQRQHASAPDGQRPGMDMG